MTKLVSNQTLKFLHRKIKGLKQNTPKITEIYQDFIKEEAPINSKEPIPTQSPPTTLPSSNSNLKYFTHFGGTSHTSKIIQRLEKNTRWGFSGQILREKNKKFQKHRLPDIEDLKQFLNDHFFSDIRVLDMRESVRPNLVQFSILSTGFNGRHVYNSAKKLLKEIEELEIEDLKCYFTGCSTSGWCIVQLGKFADIHLMNQTERDEEDLETKFMDHSLVNQRQPSDEEIKEQLRKHTNPFKFRDVNKPQRKK